MNVTSALSVSNTKFVIQELEAILVSLYKFENGVSPTFYEFKQYIVSYTADILVDILTRSDTSIFKSISPNEAVAAINLYIRNLRVL